MHIRCSTSHRWSIKENQVNTQIFGLEANLAQATDCETERKRKKDSIISFQTIWVPLFSRNSSRWWWRCPDHEKQAPNQSTPASQNEEWKQRRSQQQGIWLTEASFLISITNQIRKADSSSSSVVQIREQRLNLESWWRTSRNLGEKCIHSERQPVLELCEGP